MDEFGNLYAGDQQFGVQHHSSFLGGRTVTAAGELEVRDGRLLVWSDRSGHYLPHAEINDSALDLLRRQGLTLPDNFVRLGFDNEPRDRFGELERQRDEITQRQILLDATDQALARKEDALATPPGTEASPHGTAVRDTVRAERGSLTQRQTELDHWRSELAAGNIQRALRDQTFAHPAPRGPDDRITPPHSHGLDSATSAAHDRAAWWREHGRSWWDALHFQDLPPAFQARLLTDFPGLRNGEGIPAEVRDALNRKHIQLEIVRLGALAAGTRFGWGPRHQLHNLKNILADLHAADLEARIAAQRPGTTGFPVHLLSFDQHADGRSGGATIAFGHVDTARTVDWHAPANVSVSSMNRAITDAAQQHSRTARSQADRATLVWTGSREPTVVGQVLSRTFSGWQDSAPDHLAAAVSAFADVRRADTNAGALHQIHLHLPAAAASSAAPHLESSLVTIHESGRDQATTPAGAAQDGSRPVPSRPTPPPSRNDCAKRSFAFVSTMTHSDVIDASRDGMSGPSGVTADQFETAAGTRLQDFGSHAAIGETLLALGHRSAAVVVDAYHGAANRYGIGAHAYVLYNRNGAIWVHETTTGTDSHSPNTIQPTSARSRPWSTPPPVHRTSLRLSPPAISVAPASAHPTHRTVRPHRRTSPRARAGGPGTSPTGVSGVSGDSWDAPIPDPPRTNCAGCSRMNPRQPRTRWIPMPAAGCTPRRRRRPRWGSGGRTRSGIRTTRC